MHWISARKLANSLASGAVTAREQALYVVVTSVVWLLVGYLPVMQAPEFVAKSAPYGPLDWWPYGPIGLWAYELVLLVLISVFGIFYCLGRCRIEPRRNFLIDFSCLSAPVTITTLIVVWGVFHLYASLLPWWIEFQTSSSPPGWQYSLRFLNLVRYLAVIATSFLIFYRVGNHMERVSSLRESANNVVQGTIASDAPRAPGDDVR
jgi:hypothetical protein